LLLTPLAQSPPLFPYTTLFRSQPTFAPVVRKARLDRAALIHEHEVVGLRRKTLERQIGRGCIAGGRSGRALAVDIGVVTLEAETDRKSTRLNSSHVKISYAVFC